VFDKRQYAILTERYFETLLGDLATLAWMVGQAPLIAGLIILRWRTLQATDTLYFVIALSAVWFGCINACREIAKESEIYKRERIFGIDPAAYLASKVKILGLVGLVEVFIFYFLLERYLSMDLSMPPAFTALYGLYFSGMATGLMLSRWCGTTGRAVVAVPIVIIPQIVFSKFVLPENTLKGAAETIEKLMVVKWGFEAIGHSKQGEVAVGDFMTAMVVLIGLGVVFLIATLFHLRFGGEDI